MNKVMKKYIPGLAMGFFATIFVACCMKLFLGDDLNGFAWFVIEFSGYLVAAAVVDTVIGQIDFKSYFCNFICETLVLYPITLLFAWFGKWFGFRVTMLLGFTIAFFLIMGLIHFYFFRMMKNEADEINQFLKKRED